MDWIEIFQEINYLAVLVAVASTFAVGMFWYSPGVFGRAWMKELGMKEKDMKNKEGMGRAMVHSGIASFFASSVVAALMFATVTDGAVDGAIFGAVIGFGIAMSSMVTHDVFSKVSDTLTRINGLHDIVKFAVIGAVIGGFGF